MNGEIKAIFICPAAGDAMQPSQEAHAVPGRGLEGDRYYSKQGYYSERPGTGRDLTLIESEALEYLAQHSGIQLTPDRTRRNLLTQGVQLNSLVGKVFHIGDLRVKGVRLCDPCSYLESLTQPGVLKGLVERGGLRVDILTEGTIRVGDAVILEE
ncbi:MAG: MOSC domain-containing protein [Anaerolineales bacterium]